MPTADFYLDYARANFGPEAAPEIGRLFEQMDGTAFPELGTWIRGPGGINARAIESPIFERFKTLAALRSRVHGAGNLEQPERLYTPYRVTAGGRQIACMFRDHTLSDLIGFVYSGWNPDAAAADFVHRLVEAGRGYSARTGGEEALIPIILDGENAWEHFDQIKAKDEEHYQEMMRIINVRPEGLPES